MRNLAVIFQICSVSVVKIAINKVGQKLQNRKRYIEAKKFPHTLIIEMKSVNLR